MPPEIQDASTDGRERGATTLRAGRADERRDVADRGKRGDDGGGCPTRPGEKAAGSEQAAREHKRGGETQAVPLAAIHDGEAATSHKAAAPAASTNGAAGADNTERPAP